MQTFDQALFRLYEQGRISFEDALRFADSTKRGAPQHSSCTARESKDKDLTKGIEHSTSFSERACRSPHRRGPKKRALGAPFFQLPNRKRTVWHNNTCA